jgi:CheY-like chemotaxis protein
MYAILYKKWPISWLKPFCMMKRVLLFDDDADILEVCSIVLKASGFAVETQNSCDEIMRKVSDFRPDVVLMDNKIPPVGGIRASRKIKATPGFEWLPIVFFSANQDVAKLADEAGADYYIEKPFDLDKLVTVISRACG